MKEPTKPRILKVEQKDIDKFFEGFKKRSRLDSMEIKIVRKHLKRKPLIIQDHLYINRFLLVWKNRTDKAKICLNERLETDRRFVNTKLRLLKWSNDAKMAIAIYDRIQEMKDYLKPYEFKAETKGSLWKN